MVERKQIGVDIDGVLADFVTTFHELSRKYFGIPAPGTVQTSYHFSSLGLTPTQEDFLWNIIKKTPDFWVSLKPLPETTMLPLLKSQHDVVFVTSRPETDGESVYLQTMHWLWRYFGSPIDRLAVVQNAAGKARAADLLKLQYFIDDSVDNLKAVKSFVPHVYLAKASYNEHVKDFPVVSNFNEFACSVLKAVAAEEKFLGGCVYGTKSL